MAAGAFARIPHEVALRPELSAGAKELYTFLVARAGKAGSCKWGQEAIARELRRCVRTIQARLAELVKAKLIVRKRRGPKTNLYALPGVFPQQIELLLKSCGNPLNSDKKDPQFFADQTGSHPITEKDAPLESQSECKEQDARAVQGSATDCVSEEHRKTKRRTVERAVEAAGIDPTKDLIDKLARKAAFYGATGFQVAAAVQRCLGRVKNALSNAPRGQGWILKCVETELFWQFGDPRQKKPPMFETRGVADVSSAETVTREASGGHGHGAAGDPPTGLRPLPIETPCRPLASSGHGVRGEPGTADMFPQHETNPGWSDRAPPAAEFSAAIFQLAREKCLDARRARAG